MRADAALDYIPDMARLAGGTFTPISAFSTADDVWNPVLSRSLSTNPATNDLYHLVKSNIGPMAVLGAQQGGRSVESAVGRARRWIGEQVDDAARIPGNIEREIEQLYGVPRLTGP